MDITLYAILKNKITEIRQKLLNVVEDAADMNSRIVQNANNIEKKLDKNQGASNSGKITGINESGDIVPMFPQGVTYNEDTQCLEYGADEKLNLNAGIQLDDTLSKVGYAADAASVGELKSDIAYKIDKPNLADNNKFPRAKNGNVEWVEQGLPTDEQTENAVTNWLDEHPEATTTVQDKSLEVSKLTDNAKLFLYKDYVTPQMFGAVGDGVTDDTEAFNNAISELANGVLSTNSGQAANYATPIMFIPKGTYKITNVRLDIESIMIIGDNAILTSDETIFYARGYNCQKGYFENLVFDGGQKHVDMDVNNIEASEIRFTNCRFYNASQLSVYTNNKSANLFFDFCHFYKNTVNVDADWCDGLYFNKCWFNDKVKTNDYDCTFYLSNYCTRFTDCFFIPSGANETANEIAWIDFSGANLLFDNCRFSNEKGIKCVVNHRTPNSNDGTVNNGISFLNCTPLSCQAIRFFTLPSAINISNCFVNQVNLGYLLDFSASVDKNTLINNLFAFGYGQYMFSQISYNIEKLKTYSQSSIKLPKEILFLIHADKPCMINEKIPSGVIDVIIPQTRVNGPNDDFLNLQINFYGKMFINPGKTRIKRFEGKVVFNDYGAEIAPYVVVNGKDVTASVKINDSNTLLYSPNPRQIKISIQLISTDPNYTDNTIYLSGYNITSCYC